MPKRIVITLISLIVITLLISPAWAKPKAYLGVFPEDMSHKQYQELGITEGYGVMIRRVTEESPAARDGLLEKDILLELNGSKIYTSDQLTKMLSLFEAGQQVKLKIFRNSSYETINLILGERKSPNQKTKAYLGVYLENLDDKDYQKFNLLEKYGVLAEKIVKDGPADKAGMKDKDIIVEIQGEKIYTSDQITRMLDLLRPEQEVNIKIWRKKEFKNLDLVLGEKEYHDYSFFTPGLESFRLGPSNVLMYKYQDENGKWIGIQPRELNEQLLDSYGLKNGVMIEKVISETPAEKAGLKAGDIILKMDEMNIEKINDIHEVVKNKEIDEEVTIQIQRDKKQQQVRVKIESRRKEREGERIELSVDDGSIRMWIDGKEELLYNLQELEHLKEKLNILKEIEIEGSDIEVDEDELDIKIFQKGTFGDI